MKYIRLSDEKYPVTKKFIKQASTGKSIPKSLTAEQLLSLGYAMVPGVPKPVDSNTYNKPVPPPVGYVTPVKYDGYTHKVREGIPLKTDGVYKQVWNILGLKTQELNANLKQAKEKQHRKLEREFKENANVNVNSGNADWRGGYESSTIINSKTMLMEFNNDTTGVIYDIDDVPHEMTSQEMKQISYDIGKAYEDKYTLYQTRNKDIKTARTEQEVKKDYVW